MQHASELGQINASDPAPYHLTGNTWSILDLSAPQSGYAFAQTTDSTPPTFVSSELDTTTRVLTITFSETIDVTNVVAAKIHIRESGNYTGGGITLIAGELGTTADASTISFTLPELRLATVTGLTTPELTIEPGAVRDTSDNLIDGTFDVSTAEFVHSFSVSDEDTEPTGMAFSNDGTKMFVVGNVGNDISVYNLTAPFDLSTAAFANVIFSVLDEDILPTGMAFSNDGTKMFVVGDVGNDISVYNLTAPFDLSTAAFANVIFPVYTQDQTPTGMAFSNDGLKMFVVGWYDEDINEYTLDTPFDVSTADFDDVVLSVSDEDTEPTGMAFSNNGLKMFVVGDVGNGINEYTLSIPFDLSTAAFADVTLSVLDEDTKPQGMAFSNDGTKMFVVGWTGKDINEYTLSSVYPIMVPDTEPPVITLEGSNPATITVGYTYTDAGATCKDNVDAPRALTPSGTVDTSIVGSYVLTYSCTDTAGNVATQVKRTVNVKALPPTFVSSELDPTTGVLRITFSETIDATPTANIDPTKIHIRESGNYTGGGITMIAGELGTTADASTISFTLTAPRLETVAGLTTPELTIEPGAVRDTSGNLIASTFDVSTATFDKVTFPITRDIFPAGMAFSNDGTKMFVVGADGEDIHEYALPTPFTVSTVTHVASLSVSSPSTLPRGIAFSNDGAKMFIVDDAADNILEYALPTPFTVSTARYVDSLDIFGQEEKPRGMAFSNDGAKMFVVGNDGNDINEYTLFPPFNITSATFADVTFDVSGQDREPQGMAFSNDGTKMFVVGSTGDSIYEYTLITPFNLTTATYDGIDEKFSVMTQELVPQGMAFSNDGAKMFVVGSHGNEVNQYTLSSVYPITVTGPPAEAFITTWRTTTTDESITLPISGSGMTVNWGDGDTTAASGSVSHTYGTAGDYTIQITGELTRFHLNNAADASKLVSIDQWGTASWTTMNNAFSGASNMVYNAADSPDLSSVTDMSSMFAATTSFNGNLSSWGVSSVTDMEDMFFFATSFNGNLSGWDVSSVTDMGSMFTAATSFNGNLSGWDVSSVTDMGSMFTAASSFNGNLSGWDVSSVTDMGSMFNAASDFNQPLSSWDVSSVTDMGNMFNAASSFNGNLSGWDVSSVTDMGSMFNAASDFNQPLSSWDVSSVTDMSDMFNFASDFNQPLSSWDVSSVENMYGMFRDATSFNGNLSNWNVSSVTNMGGMFNFASDFNQPLSSWNVSSVTDMSDMFLSASSFDQNLGNWYVVPADTAYDISEGTLIVTTISAQNAVLDRHTPMYGIGSGGNSNLFNITNSNTLMFKSDPSAGTYNVVVTASGTNVFENGNNWRLLEIEVTGQTSDNTPPVIILTGDNPTVLTVGDMYTEQGAVCDDDVDADKAAIVAGDMVDANTPGQYTVTYDCTDSSSNNATQVSRTVTVGAFVTTWKTTTTDESITLPISGSGMTVNWGDGQTSTASGQVSHTYNTAGDYTIQITGELTRFYLNNAGYASKLVSIDQWGTASWTTMNNAFWGASNMVYNAADSPDLSSVTDMSDMFRDASSFNGNLSSWNVSSVTNMDSMFSGASDFNQPLSSWNVSKVTNMGSMFRSASSFNGNLSSWDVYSVTRMFSMFSGASDFNQPLSRWDVSKVTNMAAMFASASSFNGDLSRWDVSSVTSMNSMFSLASSFNGDLSSWDVSKVTNMNNMFFVISVFQQNLGNWYVVPADTAYDISEGTLIVTTISAQNAVLDRHTPMYGIGSGGNSNLFNITNSNTLMFKSDPSAGTYNVVVTASGTNVFENGNNWRAFEVTVTGQANAAPVLNSIGSKSVDELAALSFTTTATDGDNDTLMFSLTGTPPSGASIHQDTGAFSWTPTEQQDGSHSITVSVSDGNGGSDSETITVTVNEVNADPVLASVGSKQVNELAALSFTASASDGDTVGGTADTLEFSLTGTPPSGASIHQDTGAFSWTPSESQDGTHTITVQVEDGAGATDSETITVTVNEVNADPALASVGSKTVNELAVLSFTAAATDGDVIDSASDSLEFSLTGTPPSGASINQNTGAFSWTPSESQDGTHTITVQVEDGAGATDSETITVTVNEVNADPALASVGSKQVNELAALSFTASASDGDTVGGTADTLEFSLTGTPPSGASINQNTGAFSWTPTEQQDGTHTITVQVEDGAGATDSEAVTVTVSEVNITPVLNPIGSKSVNELAVLSFTVTASDGDIIGGTADSLTFSLTGTPPSGASIHQDTGAFSWTPTASQAGEHTVAFQVRDSSGATDSEDVTVTVSNSNQNPILNSIGSKSVDELAALSFTTTATDGDNDTLMFSLTGTPPSGASIHQDTGAFSWTPTEQQDGSHSITVSVSDGNGGSDSETITVTVNEVNADPVLASVGSKQVNELAALSFTAAATDGDVIDSASDSLEFSLTGTPPSGASINQNTGAFSWTPTEQQDGTHTITVQVEDGAGATDSEAVTVTVSEVNITPVLNPIGSKSVNELAVLSFTVTASDGDIIGGTADSLTFSLTGTPPSGASIHQDTGAFSWTPTASQAGEHTVAFQVRDSSGATDSEDVTVTVSNSNQNPILNSIGSKSVDELAALSFTTTATDGDNDTLMFSLTGTPPSGASIHQDTGAFSWTPTEQQDGSHSITVSVSDGNGGSDSETITVTVNEVNADPVLASVGSKQVNELAALSFTAAATDGDVIDSASDSLEFSLTGTPPSGASINQNTGAFSWTPTEQQDGTHTITVQVEDGAGATDSEAVTVTVSEVNITPVLNPIGSKSVNELAVLSFTVTASDGDIIGGTADSLTFSLTGTPPPGASIHQDTGAFSWTPTASQAGEHTVAFQVRDSSGATDSEDVTVTVSNSNQNPILNSIGSKSVDELAALSFTTTATDGDNDTLMFSLTGTPPSGASIHQDTGAFSWTPTEQQDGSHSVTVRVSDGNGGSDSETITVTVNEVNADPVLASVGSKQVNELAALSFTAAATDGDVIDSASDSLEFSLTGTPPSGASINQNTGAFSWTPTEQQDGTHTITIQVEDGAGATDSEAVTVTVSEVNITPVLNPIGSKSVNELAVLSFTVTASDGDIIGGTADSLTFSLTGTPPPGASIHQDTGAFSWTPTASQAGEHTVAFQVRDSSGATDSEDVTVTVSNSNQNPILNSIGSKSVDELAALSFTTTATDGDNDTLMFSLTGTPPSGASIHQDTGAFSWTPTEQQDGSHSVTVRVSDGNGGTASETVTVTVGEVNTAPVLDSIGPQGVNMPGTLTFTATATDGDVIAGVSDTMTFSMTGAPAGASMDSLTGTFSWTPAESQTGTYTMTVRVDDGSGASDSENVTVTATEGGTNDAPVLDFIGSQEINELGTLEFTATATDNDGDSLTFTMAGDRPRGASMTPGGMFSWTPDQSQDGDYSITVRVSDGRGGTDSEVVTVTVHDIAPLPVSARASSSSAIALTLSETVTSEGQGSNGFEVMMEGDPVSVESITGSGTTTLTLNLDGTISASDGVVRLSYSDATGDVADENGNPLASFSDLDVLFPSQRRGGTTPPAVDLGTLAYQRSVDIPPHIAEQIVSHDASEPLEPITPDGTFDFPLVINGYGYLLDDVTNTLVPQILTVGDDDPATITFTVYTQKDLAHFALYLNLQGENTNYADSDTYITYKNDDGTTGVTDPHGYIDNAAITVTQEDEDSVPEKKTISITIEFGEEPMGSTNMVAYMWNTDRKATFIKIIDAIGVAAALLEPVVQAADPEPLEPDSELPADPEPVAPDLAGDVVDPEPVPYDILGPDDYDEAQVLHIIRMWSGFESEMITDTQLLELLGLEGYRGVDLPDWMITELGVLAAKGDVATDEFLLALQYVLENL